MKKDEKQNEMNKRMKKGRKQNERKGKKNEIIE